MVDRIDKTDRVEYWRVESSAESQKQQGQQREGEDAFASFQEKTDWKLLFDKSSLWRKNIQVLKEEITHVIFRKLNLKTDPSLLRVDIHLKGEERISPAFVPIARVNAFKIKNLNSGDPLPIDQLFPGHALYITVPSNPALFAEQEKGIPKPQAEPEPKTDDKDEPTIRSRPASLLKPFIEALRPYGMAIYVSLLALFVLGGLILLL